MTDADNHRQARDRVRAFGKWAEGGWASFARKQAELYDGLIRPGDTDPDLQQYDICINDILSNVHIQMADNMFNDPEFVVECLSAPNDDGERITEAYLTGTWRYSKMNEQAELAYLRHAVFGIAPVLSYVGDDGWPKIRSLDPRMCIWDQDMETFTDQMEFFAVRYYLPIWEVKRLYPKSKAMDIKPDVVEVGDNRKRYIGELQKSNRCQVIEYWQREDRYHAVWLTQAEDKPLMSGDISDTEYGPDPAFPAGLVVPIRILPGVQSFTRSVPHSWVELGEETQKALNVIDASLMTSGKRAAPGFLYDKGMFDADAQGLINEGNIQGGIPCNGNTREAMTPLPSSGFNQDLVFARSTLAENHRIAMNVTSFKQGVGTSRETATAATYRTSYGNIRSAWEEKKVRRFTASLAEMTRDRWLYHGSDGVSMKVYDRQGQVYYQEMTHGAMNEANLYFPAYIELKEGSMLMRDTATDQQIKMQALTISAQLAPIFQQFYGQVPNLMMLLQEFYRSLGYKDIGKLLGEGSDMNGAMLDPMMLQALVGRGGQQQGNVSPEMMGQLSGMLGNGLAPNGAEAGGMNF